jgi:hypothetical protein
MLFGLTNAPTTFQLFINDTLHEYLDIFNTAYWDDILIESDTYEKNKTQVHQVVEKLKAAGIVLKAEKCEFSTQQTTFICLIVSPQEINMDPQKTIGVAEWNTFKNFKDVQAFLRFANFYRQFIQGFAALASPLSAITKKEIPFVWTETFDSAFQALKTPFKTTPIL